jgi:hypothetical protein
LAGNILKGALESFEPSAQALRVNEAIRLGPPGFGPGGITRAHQEAIAVEDGEAGFGPWARLGTAWVACPLLGIDQGEDGRRYPALLRPAALWRKPGVGGGRRLEGDAEPLGGKDDQAAESRLGGYEHLEQGAVEGAGHAGQGSIASFFQPQHGEQPGGDAEEGVAVGGDGFLGQVDAVFMFTIHTMNIRQHNMSVNDFFARQPTAAVSSSSAVFCSFRHPGGSREPSYNPGKP